MGKKFKITPETMANSVMQSYNKITAKILPEEASFNLDNFYYSGINESLNKKDSTPYSEIVKYLTGITVLDSGDKRSNLDAVISKLGRFDGLDELNDLLSLFADKGLDSLTAYLAAREFYSSEIINKGKINKEKIAADFLKYFSKYIKSNSDLAEAVKNYSDKKPKDAERETELTPSTDASSKMPRVRPATEEEKKAEINREKLKKQNVEPELPAKRNAPTSNTEEIGKRAKKEKQKLQIEVLTKKGFTEEQAIKALESGKSAQEIIKEKSELDKKNNLSSLEEFLASMAPGTKVNFSALDVYHLELDDVVPLFDKYNIKQGIDESEHSFIKKEAQPAKPILKNPERVKPINFPPEFPAQSESSKSDEKKPDDKKRDLEDALIKFLNSSTEFEERITLDNIITKVGLNYTETELTKKITDLSSRGTVSGKVENNMYLREIPKLPAPKLPAVKPVPKMPATKPAPTLSSITASAAPAPALKLPAVKPVPPKPAPTEDDFDISIPTTPKPVKNAPHPVSTEPLPTAKPTKPVKTFLPPQKPLPPGAQYVAKPTGLISQNPGIHPNPDIVTQVKTPPIIQPPAPPQFTGRPTPPKINIPSAEQATAPQGLYVPPVPGSLPPLPTKPTLKPVSLPQPGQFQKPTVQNHVPPPPPPGYTSLGSIPSLEKPNGPPPLPGAPPAGLPPIPGMGPPSMSIPGRNPPRPKPQPAVTGMSLKQAIDSEVKDIGKHICTDLGITNLDEISTDAGRAKLVRNFAKLNQDEHLFLIEQGYIRDMNQISELVNECTEFSNQISSLDSVFQDDLEHLIENPAVKRLNLSDSDVIDVAKRKFGERSATFDVVLNQYITKYYSSMNPNQIAQRLGVNVNYVNNSINELGLKSSRIDDVTQPPTLSAIRSYNPEDMIKDIKKASAKPVTATAVTDLRSVVKRDIKNKRIKEICDELGLNYSQKGMDIVGIIKDLVTKGELDKSVLQLRKNDIDTITNAYRV